MIWSLLVNNHILYEKTQSKQHHDYKNNKRLRTLMTCRPSRPCSKPGKPPRRSQHVAQHVASSLMVFIYGRNNPRIWGLHGRDKISTDSSQESNRPSASIYYHNVIIYVHRSTVIVTPCKQPPLHPPRVSQIHASVHSEWSKAQIWHVPLEQMAQNAQRVPTTLNWRLLDSQGGKVCQSSLSQVKG